MFAFWKPQSFGIYRETKKGGEHCYSLEKGEPGRVVLTSKGSQIVRSWGKRAGRYLEVTELEPVFLSKWPWVPLVADLQGIAPLLQSNTIKCTEIASDSCHRRSLTPSPVPFLSPALILQLSKTGDWVAFTNHFYPNRADAFFSF